LSGKRKREYISARIDPDNYMMVRNVADILFRGEDDASGNFSRALDYILEQFRLDNEFSKLLSLIKCKAEFERGVRTKEVINGAKRMDFLVAKLSKVES